MFGLEGRLSIDNGAIATLYVRRYNLSVYTLESAHKDPQPQIDKLQLHKHKGYDTLRNFNINTRFLLTQQCISSYS
jgi:hypothetical protein